MHILPLTSITIAEDRERLDLPITDLVESIPRSGLLQPIVIREDGALVAGGRRLRAITHLHTMEVPIPFNNSTLPPDTVPCVYLNELHPESARQAELEENLRRINLTWQEEVRALAELHEILKRRAPEQTLKATALEAFGPNSTQAAVTKIREAQILAKQLDDPTISNQQTHSQAMAALKKKVRRLATAALVKADRKTIHTLHHGDFRSFEFPPVDLILTDPPYGIRADRHGEGTSSGLSHHTYSDSHEYWKEIMGDFIQLLPTITKKKAHIYIFCDFGKFTELSNLIQSLGEEFFTWPRPLIWDKGGSGRLPHPDLGPRRVYECILYAIRNNRKVQKNGHDVLRFGVSREPVFAAQKPTDLYQELIVRSCTPGDIVLDPFCGSGTIFPAANRTHTVAIGCEIDKETHSLAAARVHEDAVIDIEDSLL